MLLTFVADRVFDQNSTTVQVYNELVKPIVGKVMLGFNGMRTFLQFSRLMYHLGDQFHAFQCFSLPVFYINCWCTDSVNVVFYRYS